MNIFTVPPYVYKATASGLSVYDLNSEALLGFEYITGGVSSVWADTQYVYSGTTTSGLYRSSVSLPTLSTPYKQYPDISSNLVNYVHGNGDYLCVVTNAGVDRFNTQDDSRVQVTCNNLNKCFQASTGDFYFVENSMQLTSDIDISLLDWAYYRTVQLSRVTSVDDYTFTFEVDFTDVSALHSVLYNNGSDIRIMSATGKILPHYVEYSNGMYYRIVVKLPVSSSMFYVLYGNKDAVDASDFGGAFMFYDDFSGTSLDTTKWNIDCNSYAPNTVTVQDGFVRLKSYSYSYYASINSKTTFSGGLLEYSVRKSLFNPSYLVSLRFTSGFTTGPSAFIGGDLTRGGPHRLISDTSYGTVIGTSYMPSSFTNASVLSSANSQNSTYGSESITTSGVLSIQSSNIIFKLYNDYYGPYVDIDWVRVRVYDPSPPTYTVSGPDLVVNMSTFSTLHSVYADGSSYDYASGRHNTLNATYVNDLFVTEGTSVYDDANVIFLATNNGAIVIEEKRGDEANCRKKIYLIES